MKNHTHNGYANACIGCGEALRTPQILNALSRYGNGYICSDCGTREAFEGDFIATICGGCIHARMEYGQFRCPTHYDAAEDNTRAIAQTGVGITSTKKSI